MKINSKAPTAACISLVALVSSIICLPRALDGEILNNDEMLHLQSWSRQYGTRDIYPRFLLRLEEVHGLSGDLKAMARAAYGSSELIQRATLCLTDGHPPLHPVVAEVCQVTTNSSLSALRLVSLACTLLGLLCAARIGMAITPGRFPTCVVGLMSTGLLTVAYTSIGRPYTMGQLSILCAILAFIMSSRRTLDSSAPSKTLVAALLFAQSTMWQNWIVVSPIAASMLLTAWVGRNSITDFVKRIAFYAFTSMTMLAYLSIQLLNPTLGSMAGVQSGFLNRLAPLLPLASPFSWMGYYSSIAALIGFFLFLVLALAGLYAIPRDRLNACSSRWVLASMLITSAVSVVAAKGEARHLMPGLVVPTLLAGLAADRMMERRPSLVSIPASTIIFVIPALTYVLRSPPDHLTYLIRGDTEYPVIARDLSQKLEIGNTWTAWPPHIGDCLFRYTEVAPPLPAPSQDKVLSYAQHQPARPLSVVTKGNALEDALKRTGLPWTSTVYRGDFRLVHINAK